MKNSWDNWGNNFIEWPESLWDKIIWTVKNKVFWVFFIASVENKITGEFEDEYQYSTLSEEDYKKVLETKYSINPTERVNVDVRNWFWHISKTQLWVQGVFLIN